MNRYGRDMMRRQMRDGRNPYGSRGGYIVSRDPRDRAMRDWREPAYEKRSGRYDDMENSIGRPAHVIGEEYDRSSRYPFSVSGEFGRYDGHHYDPYMEDEMYYGGMDGRRNRNGRYMRDSRYEDDESILSKEVLDMWAKRLMGEIEEKDKPMLNKETIMKKAEDMGIKFDKFTKEEFYVTVLMIVTDYGKTLGMSNIDLFIRLAKDWLCDEDSGLKYGDKLEAYYYDVIEA